MGLTELFILAVGLSMDAFAVSVCKGLSSGKAGIKQMATAGAWFGGFQALMPFIGYLLGSSFADMVSKYSHWIAFALLILIGCNMIKEAVCDGDDESEDDGSMSPANMLLLAIATSIDALAVGVTFAFLKVAIVPAISFIGSVTFVISAAGVKIGSLFGTRYKKGSEIAGGIILIVLAFKIMLEGVGVL